MTWAILVSLVLAGLVGFQARARPLVQEIERSTDVAWLERISTDALFAESEDASRSRYVAVKNSRGAAYVRLGALGTPESVAAIARIESAARGRSIQPPRIVPGGRVNHAAPHMGDSTWTIAADAALPDGRRVGALTFDWYGPRSLFLATQAEGRWSRPHLVPIAVPHEPVITLEPLAAGRLRVRFSAGRRQGEMMSQIHPTPDAVEVTLAEVERDSDGDGWTDVEEQYLELGFRLVDSDLDGLPDNRDAAPNYKDDGKSTDSGEAQIIQRAIFAMFGFTESPGALFVGDDSRRVQVYGLPGPVFYRAARGAVQVTWKIVERTASEATVQMTDFENVLAASGNAVKLRRIGDGWYVVSIRGLWIS